MTYLENTAAANASGGKNKVGISNLSKRSLYAIELVLLLSLFVIFATSKAHDLADSKYSILVTENLLRDRTFVIDKRAVPRVAPFMTMGYQKSGYPYQLELVNGNLLYGYPIGSSVLSLPFVALINAAGVSARTSQGRYSERGDRYIQTMLASLLMATLAVTFFRTALLILPVTWSLVLALGGSLSTQIWSTASRVLWSHTWQIFLLGAVIYILLSEEEREARRSPIGLATLLSWAYFVRPTSSIPIAAISVYMLMFRRRKFLAYAITGALWMTVFVIYSWSVSGRVLPRYYLFHLGPRHLSEAFAGNLISPSRGLFVFVPASAFALLLVGYYWRVLRQRPLAILSLAIITVHLILVSTDPNWWGGHCYGPRLSTDIVPWFFLLGTLGCRGLLDERPSALKRCAVTLGLLTLVTGAFTNGRGALSYATNGWVNVPDVDQYPQRVWDWSDPQFLAGLSFTRQH